MANEIELKFGTLELNSTNNITISNIDVKENKAVKAFNIPKSDSAVAETAKRNTLLITVSGDIAGTGYDDLRSNLDALRAGLQNGKQQLTLDDDRYIVCQLKNFSYPFVKLQILAKWTAVFISNDPVWLAQSETVDDRTPTSGVGYTVNNPGNAPVRVKIEFTAPGGGIADNIQFENTTNGELMKYRGTLAAGNDLEVDNRFDTEDFEVLNNGVDDHANYEGDFITLEPGNNTLEFTGEASTDVKVTFRAGFF